MAALIIVDMVNDFASANGTLFCGQVVRDIIPVIRRKLKEAREAEQLIIYLCESHTKDDKEFERFPEHCVKGTLGADIIAELTPENSDMEYIINKRRHAGFFDTKLYDVLKRHNVTDVELVGVCTSICIADTAVGAVNRDLGVLVDKTAVADFDQTASDASLKRLEAIYGVIVTP